MVNSKYDQQKTFILRRVIYKDFPYLLKEKKIIALVAIALKWLASLVLYY